MIWCQLEHSLSNNDVKNSLELDSVDKMGAAKNEDDDGVLTKLHNIR